MYDFSPTITLFCHQIWKLDAKILLLQSSDETMDVVTHQTPFHPVSHIWPDHPADKGTLNGCPVLDCKTGAIEQSSGKLYVGEAIPVKRDQAGWVFVVVHCMAKEHNQFVVGETVMLAVDKPYQLSLSRGHSAGHLAALALNKVLDTHGYWRKVADRTDCHGYYDFNSYAQESSFVKPDQCLDTYRLGKTLRKRGLNSADVLEDLVAIEALVNQQVEQWLSLGSDIDIICCGRGLTDSRYWRCDLGEERVAQMPCGGTHAKNLNEYKGISVILRQIDVQNIEMVTHATAEK